MPSRIYDFNLAGAVGATQLLSVTGQKVKLLKATGPVRVSTDRGDIYEIAEGQGFTAQRAEGFQNIYVTNMTGSINVGTIFIGDSTFDDSRISGSVRIVDEITDQIQVVRGNSPTAIVGFGAAVVVAPNLNTRGMILRHFELIGAAGAGGDMGARLVAAKSTPTGFGVPAQQWPIASVVSQTTAQTTSENSFVNKLMPPGWGLYHVFNINTAAAGTNFYQAAFELLL